MILIKIGNLKRYQLFQYIFTLDDMIKHLQTLSSKPSKDTMMSYIKRIDFLKGLVNTSKLTSPVDRVVAVQMLPKNSTTFNDSIGPNITTQIHQKTSAKYNKELRAELFHNDKGISEDGIRQRSSTMNMQDDDLDALLKYNRNIQEKIAENMLSMTSSIKEHALAANAIIKKDIGLLEKSDKLTDINTNKLKTESLKLQEHTQSYWRCWMWVMIAFVLVIFFNMVLFIKVAKKRV
ncbi:vesicle transport protein USE1 isoform X2 [Apis mellifera]|uniref:Vesicle transport protein USE1 n=1 Tax=Apis mellifera TaxID=7460 RepID=A0A7M7L5I1_APIME|nr:vesicle transport protein USE1 isoform X2 [Apis mellifera]|eukprot:XP_026296860.1 vesicle transport protein USE1 isoform X2 [Apis mellifera]